MGASTNPDLRVASLLDALQETLSEISKLENPRLMLNNLRLLRMDLESLITEISIKTNADPDPSDLITRDSFDALIEMAGPDVVPELLYQLVSDLTDLQEQLPKSLAEMNWDAIRSNSHVIIALSGSIGATKLETMAIELNLAAHSQEKEIIEKFSPKIFVYLGEAIAFLRAEIEMRGLLAPFRSSIPTAEVDSRD